MKKVMVFLVIVLAMVLVSAVSAQPSTYDSGFQVANLSGSDANIVISYVNKDGSTDATVNGTIPANGSVTYFPIGASAGFDGSVVISSNQPVAAIANVLGDGFAFGASYESFDSGAPATLVDFAVWAMKTYPAKRYALILSDHGAGWVGGWMAVRRRCPRLGAGALRWT